MWRKEGAEGWGVVRGLRGLREKWGGSKAERHVEEVGGDGDRGAVEEETHRCVV